MEVLNNFNAFFGLINNFNMITATYISNKKKFMMKKCGRGQIMTPN